MLTGIAISFVAGVVVGIVFDNSRLDKKVTARAKEKARKAVNAVRAGIDTAEEKTEEALKRVERVIDGD